MNHSKRRKRKVYGKILSKHCKKYRIWEQKNDRSEYEEWKATHQYINHEKSSGSMVAAGAVEIFQYSVQKKISWFINNIWMMVIHHHLRK